MKAKDELRSVKGLVHSAVNDRDQFAEKLRAVEQGVDVKWKQVLLVLIRVLQ